VLGWGVSQRDLEVLLKLVGQLICAAAADGGATIVVLTQREKLDMEELFRWVWAGCLSRLTQQQLDVECQHVYVCQTSHAIVPTMPTPCCRRRSLPPSLRAGSRLVFRQGSPLLPSDLRRVAASSARATIILSDQSRGRDEADAQSLRCGCGTCGVMVCVYTVRICVLSSACMGSAFKCGCLFVQGRKKQDIAGIRD
jgi:hypothetical protein